MQITNCLLLAHADLHVNVQIASSREPNKFAPLHYEMSSTLAEKCLPQLVKASQLAAMLTHSASHLITCLVGDEVGDHIPVSSSERWQACRRRCCLSGLPALV